MIVETPYTRMICVMAKGSYVANLFYCKIVQLSDKHLSVWRTLHPSFEYPPCSNLCGAALASVNGVLYTCVHNMCVLNGDRML